MTEKIHSAILWINRKCIWITGHSCEMSNENIRSQFYLNIIAMIGAYVLVRLLIKLSSI